MKKSLYSIHKATCSIACCILASLIMHEAYADGTEFLGTPSIPIAPGSDLVVAGTGLADAQPGEIALNIPADVSIAQVLLYWAGRGREYGLTEDTIQVNGTAVTGPCIGGPSFIPLPSNTFRADITELSSALNWISAGQTNVLTVDGLDFLYHNAGAAVVVILDDGNTADIQIMDGDDFAYLWAANYLPASTKQTEPVEFAVPLSDDSQTGTMVLIITDIEDPRPAAVEVTVGNITTQLNVFEGEGEGSFLDIIELEVPVPAGVSNVTVQALSIDDGSGLMPASLDWHFVSWKLSTPDTPPPGIGTYTIGYWKNHPDDWPEYEDIFTPEEAMEILWMPTKGNAYIILAHQYIGAKLNEANGAEVPDEVALALDAAKDLLAAYKSDPVFPKKSFERQMAIAIAEILDDYNNGVIGPGHNDD
ncbi:MAG: hypothetical protein JXR25_03825 [Pontiellaceae bacterium]|nr:hypothetical protein [Pontiellaceae bacterium]MBN2783930.1 hypothetical protein [Pontiellaceae bacterium]